jgi:PAS domain S-box-containing protein
MLRLSLRPNVVAAYLSALMVCAMGWLVYQRLDGAESVTAQSRTALATMDAVRSLDGAMRDANLAERDLVVTNDPRYAGVYAAASDGTVRALAALREVSAPYPGVASRLDSLGYFVHLRLGELDETVRLRRDGGAKAAADVLRSQRSNESDRKIDQLLGSIAATVGRSASGTAAGLRAEGRLILLLIAITAVLAVLLAFFVNVMHARNVRAQRRMTEELENQSLQLQIQANELTATNRELESATTEMLRQTVEAERSEMRLAGILGSATDAVVSFDDDERIVYFNAAARRLFGIDEALLPGARIRTAIADRSSLAFEEHMLAARRSAHIGEANPEVWDTVVVRPGDDEIPVEVSMAYARTGKQGLFTAVLRDVSRQRQFEEEFRQAQKMEAVGRLAGGIAHDFNNLLTVIGASSDFLLHDLRGQSSSLSADVREIKAATNRAASLTRQLLAFSRRQLVQPQLLDLNAVVREMETMLRRLIGENMMLATSYSDDIGLVKLDRGQLEQIVVNLVVNARDAMPDGGTVSVCTGTATADTNGIPVECVTLSVADAGVGMDEQTRARIFEPFFTTKEQGKGTGLGLSTVYGIVKASGGDIEVQSDVDEGTEFQLRFPCVGDEVATPPVEQHAPDTIRGVETVLVVEDEEPLRRLTRRILESRGYTVFDAADGDEAIQTLASLSSRVDLVLTDVVMPGMSGRELVERLLPVYPWLRVLFMSGYTEDMMLQHRIAELGITVVEKPFTRDDLARAVRNTLDRAAQTIEVG